MARNKGIDTVVTNRKAYHNYHIADTFEAGLELTGAEVKSLRQKEASLEGAYVRVEKDMQAVVYHVHIKPYKFNTLGDDYIPTRPRKLLLHKKEIHKIAGHGEIKGNTVIPLEIYFKNGWAKLKIGLGKGKQLYDKREDIKKRDLNREMEQNFKNKIRF